MSAPKGNRFALGNKGGRPSMYDTVDQLWEKASEYFVNETTNTGICKPTISGLMFHLGFCTRTSFYDYKKKGVDSNGDSWANCINFIEQFIESCYEKNLHGFAWAGSAFALRNIRGEYWKEETTQNQIVNNVAADFGKTISTTPESENNT